MTTSLRTNGDDGGTAGASWRTVSVAGEGDESYAIVALPSEKSETDNKSFIFYKPIKLIS